MAVDVDCEVLPKGWLSCDACGRIMPATVMGKHLGSTACMYECKLTLPPPTWQPVYVGSRCVTLEGLRNSNAPTLLLPSSTIRYTPPWVNVVLRSGATSVSALHVLNRASHDHVYRAGVVAGLKLINSKDIEATEALIAAAE